MLVKNKKIIWDHIESELICISENRLQENRGFCNLSISVLISSGRDQDVTFINSIDFETWCQSALLEVRAVRKIIQSTIEYINSNYTGEFYLTCDNIIDKV